MYIDHKLYTIIIVSFIVFIALWSTLAIVLHFNSLDIPPLLTDGIKFLVSTLVGLIINSNQNKGE